MDYDAIAKAALAGNVGGAATPVSPESTPELTGDSWLSQHPWLTGLGVTGALAAGLLLKRPGLLESARSLAANAGTKLAAKLPKEYPLLKSMPTSPVISLTEKHATDYGQALEKAVAGPLKGLIPERRTLIDLAKGVEAPKKPLSPQEWVDLEDRMHSAFKAMGGDARAKAAAMELLPNELKPAFKYLETELRPAEQQAAKYLGERVLDDVPYPYIPRIVQKDFDNMVKVGGYTPGLRSDIRSTLGAFEKERAFPTMKQGIMAGEEYLDPALSTLYRTHAGLKLVHTANYIKTLEDAGVIFRNPETAKVAGGQAIKLEGVPGSGQWFARSKIEAQFLADQLANPKAFGPAALVHQANEIFRNYNLINPLPHFTKNMMYKYGFSGGNLTKVYSDAREFATKSNPALLARFNAVMPFTETGKNATDVLLNAKGAIEGSTLAGFKRGIESVQNWSSRMVFSKFDPWLRYSRWKQYVQQGMDDQTAANHVWIDLIRYGTRSDLVDFWKNIPLNFFVPWRVGTITSLLKNVQLEPARAAMFVGAVDTLREVLYRKTGWWFHTPIDYVEAPIMKTLEAFGKKPQTGAADAAAIGMTTSLFGPGGQHSDKLIRNVLKFVDEGSVDHKTLTNVFWGLASIFDPYGTLPTEVLTFAQDKDPKHLVRAFQNVALAAHDALNYRPRRFLQAIPESVIGKAPHVQQAEALQERAATNRERREQRPYRSIKDRIGDY